jgi:hypothetical protein
MRKMKTIVIIIFLLYTRILIAQDYYDYYENINKAKLSIIEDSLEKAMDHYFETFEKFDFVFARDCFNALEIASALGDNDKVDYFLRRCLKQGIDLNILEKDSILTDFKKTDAWSEILLDKDSLRGIYERNVNWDIRKEINGMFAKDQEIRELAHKNRFNIFRIKKLNKQFEEVDRKFVLRILAITKEYGFPGEKLIGIDGSKMHPKINSENLTAGMPIVIFIHHFSQPNESFNSLLIGEVKKGNLLNEHFATISDFQYTYGKGSNREKYCYSMMFNPKLNIEVIDNNRNNIKLLSVSKTNELKRKKLITPKYYLY